MKVVEIISNLGPSDYLLLMGIALITYVTHFYYKYFTRINPLPGPIPFPLVGNIPQFYLHGGNMKEFADYNLKKYGDVYEVHMNGRIISLSRLEHIEKLLTPSTKSPYLQRSPHSRGVEEMGVTGGVGFNNDLKSWRFHRQFFSQAVLAPKLTLDAVNGTNILFSEMESYWNNLYVQGKVKENQKLDISKWLNNFTNDMIIMLLTGERSYTMAGYFNTLSSEETAKFPSAVIEDSVKLVGAFRKFLEGVGYFATVSTFMRHYIPHFKRRSEGYIKNVKFINKRLDATINKRRQEIENTPLDKPLTRDMLTSIITANTPRDVNPIKTVGGEVMRPLTDYEIRVLLLEGFVGGTDTTANLTSFILYYIERNPDVKRKLLEEIERVFQGDKLTEEIFSKLKYCEAISKEVARISPIAHTLSRHSEAPGEIAGYQWPTGTTFRMNVGAIHNSEHYWEEPEKFNPDRWMAEGFEPKKYSYVMFGGGLRICPGRKLAMIEVVSFISWLYKRYEIELVDKEAPVNIVYGPLTTCPELLINIKPRN